MGQTTTGLQARPILWLGLDGISCAYAPDQGLLRSCGRFDPSLCGRLDDGQWHRVCLSTGVVSAFCDYLCLAKLPACIPAPRCCLQQHHFMRGVQAADVHMRDAHVQRHSKPVIARTVPE